MNKYKLGIIDPPWTYDNKQQNDPKRGGITYNTLTMKELYDIPIGNAFADDSIIVVWVTHPKLMDTYYSSKEKVGGIKNGAEYNPLSIIRQWGFRPITTLFVWVKLNPKAQIHLLGDKTGQKEIMFFDDVYSGLGRYTNSNTEMAIVARKGKGLPRIGKNVKQLIFAPIGEHSAKPQEQYDRLEKLYGPMEPYDRIEIFARKQNPPPIGWDATGLDYDGIDIREWIKQYDIESNSR